VSDCCLTPSGENKLQFDVVSALY